MLNTLLLIAKSIKENDVSRVAIFYVSKWSILQKLLLQNLLTLEKFLEEELKVNPMKCEYYLPKVVSALPDAKKATVKVLTSADKGGNVFDYDMH